jgi:PST family polysaccharide transporter
LDNKFQEIFKKTQQHKTLIQNFSYLSLLQVFNVLIPFITYPYLIRVLGKETYGLVIYAQVIVTYLQILVDFGFDTSATKDVSVNRDNKQKLSEIFSSIFILKGSFFLISLIILGIVLQFIPESTNHQTLFWLSMWYCLYNVLFPIWFFQGIEKMKYITILNLISRSIFLVLIFILIKGPDDYLLYPLINGIGAVFAGSLAIYIVLKKEGITFIIPSIKTLYNYLHSSLDFFISTVSVKIFVSSNKFIIGTFLGLSELAFYDLADKVVSLFRTVPLDIVRNTIYPRVAKTKNALIIKKTTIIMGIYALIAVAFLNIFATPIVKLLGGVEMLPSVNIIRLYSIIIITNQLSNYYITVGLWSFGYVKVFRNMMIISSALYLLIYFIFWILGCIDIYTVTLTPVIIDVYLLLHIFFFWKNLKIEKIDG